LATVQELYNYELLRIDVKTRTVDEMIVKLRLPERAAEPANQKLVAEYGAFLARDIPLEVFQQSHSLLRGGLIGPYNKAYQEWVHARFGRIEKINKAYGIQASFWAECSAPFERIGFRDWAPLYDQRYRDYLEFKKTVPAWLREPFEGTGKWIAHLKFASDGD